MGGFHGLGSSCPAASFQMAISRIADKQFHKIGEIVMISPVQRSDFPSGYCAVERVIRATLLICLT